MLVQIRDLARLDLHVREIARRGGAEQVEDGAEVRRRHRGDELLQAAGLQRRQEPVRGRCGHAAGSGRLRERGELRLRQREELLDLVPVQLRGGPLHLLRPVRLHERLDLRPPEVAGEVLQTRVPDLARQCLELGRAAELCAEWVDGAGSDLRDEVLEAREVVVERVDERVARGRIRRVLREVLAPGRDGARRRRGRARGRVPARGLPRDLSGPGGRLDRDHPLRWLEPDPVQPRVRHDVDGLHPEHVSLRVVRDEHAPQHGPDRRVADVHCPDDLERDARLRARGVEVADPAAALVDVRRVDVVDLEAVLVAEDEVLDGREHVDRVGVADARARDQLEHRLPRRLHLAARRHRMRVGQRLAALGHERLPVDAVRVALDEDDLAVGAASDAPFAAAGVVVRRHVRHACVVERGRVARCESAGECAGGPLVRDRVADRLVRPGAEERRRARRRDLRARCGGRRSGRGSRARVRPGFRRGGGRGVVGVRDGRGGRGARAAWARSGPRGRRGRRGRSSPAPRPGASRCTGPRRS